MSDVQFFKHWISAVVVVAVVVAVAVVVEGDLGNVRRLYDWTPHSR